MSLRTAMDLIELVSRAPWSKGLPEMIRRARANATDAERPAVERAIERIERGDLLRLYAYPNWPEYPTSMPMILSPAIAHLANSMVTKCAMTLEDALDEIAKIIRDLSS
jgi:hypothetical protein